MGKKNTDIDSLMDDINEKERRSAEASSAPEAQDAEEGPQSMFTAASPIASITQPAQRDDGIISFGHFAAVDLRVGRILEVEDHPGARKPMYKLRVDLGELGVRQLVAGIKSFYSKEELIGRNIIVVANLEPRKIAGIESQGMLLAAEDGADVALIRPDRDFRAGTKIG